jgi:hypothetical protein
MMALLAGGATLARSVEDVGVEAEITTAVTDTVAAITGEEA